MRKFLNMFKKNDNAFSIGRVVSFVMSAELIGISLYLALLGKTWPNYDTFAYVCVACLLTQLGNKVVDVKGIKIESEKKEGERK